MKLNFKTILVIFLVALLGGIIGTFGVIEINKATGNKIIEQDSNVTLTTVDYPTIEKSNYAIAISKAYDSVVEISSTKTQTSFFGITQGESLGSGVIISSDGYIVTNNHVVENAIDVKVTLSNSEEYDAKIIGTDPKSDLAVVKIEAENLKFSAIADSSNLVLGQECIVIGNPLGEGISCSNGIISALEKEIVLNNYPMSLIQTNAAVNEGNSGGGLFNMNGDLIGVVNAKSSSNSLMGGASIEGMGYAIPASRVKKIVTDLVDYGYVKARATLGVSIYTATTFDNGDKYGVIVAQVVENSAADKAGIKVYDIISEIDGEPIASYADLSKVLDKHDVGDTVEALVYRGYEDMMYSKNPDYNFEELRLSATLQEASQVVVK